MKKAFTLAEVLITLAIIGVVAAISIPSVISNSQQQRISVARMWGETERSAPMRANGEAVNFI